LISEGPAIGVLTLFTEGNNYLDFSNVRFRYNKIVFIEEYDLYYPVDLTITAKLEDKKLELRAWSICDPYEYIDKFKGNGFYKAFIMPEMPGKIKGEYKDNNRTEKLEGDCKIEVQRQPSKLGHNSMIIDFIKPPKGVGISFDFNSHYLKKKIYTKFQLAPNLKIKYHF